MRRYLVLVTVLAAVVLGGSGVAAAGGGWTLQKFPTPSGTLRSTLYGVSCPAAGSCTAVGSAGTSYGSTPLAERWNGSTWTAQTVTLPSGASDSYAQFLGVSCVSAADCTAAGDYYNASQVELTLAEHWNGTAWAIQTTANPSGSAVLNGVSCPSATVCTAVGSVAERD